MGGIVKLSDYFLRIHAYREYDRIYYLSCGNKQLSRVDSSITESYTDINLMKGFKEFSDSLWEGYLCNHSVYMLLYGELFNDTGSR